MKATTARIVREIARLRPRHPITPPITRNGVLMTWSTPPADYIAPKLRRIDHFLALPHRKQRRAKALMFWSWLHQRERDPMLAGFCDLISYGAERMAVAAKRATRKIAEAASAALAKVPTYGQAGEAGTF